MAAGEIRNGLHRQRCLLFNPATLWCSFLWRGLSHWLLWLRRWRWLRWWEHRRRRRWLWRAWRRNRYGRTIRRSCGPRGGKL